VTRYNRSLSWIATTLLLVALGLGLCFGAGCAAEQDPIALGDLKFAGEIDVDTGEIAEYLKHIVELQPRPELYTYVVEAHERVTSDPDTGLHKFTISLDIAITANEDIVIRDVDFTIDSVASGGHAAAIPGSLGKRLFDTVQAGGAVDVYVFQAFEVGPLIMDQGYTIQLELDIDRDI
jgi:hypothetical protein